jgi:hypothetical protein
MAGFADRNLTVPRPGWPLMDSQIFSPVMVSQHPLRHDLQQADAQG